MTGRADEPVFLSDAEIAERLGLGEKAFAIASRQPGFPRKMRIYAGKRWWPAVTRFIESQNQPTLAPAAPAGPRPGIVENFDDEENPRRRRARMAAAG